MTYELYSTNGDSQQVDSDIFGVMPEGSIALKFSDEVDEARWVKDRDELSKLRLSGASVAVTEEQYWEEQIIDRELGDV